MNQSNHQLPKNVPLERLVSLALDQLRQLGYSRKSLYRYKTTWKHFIEFSRQEQLGDVYSDKLAAYFLKEHLLKDGELIGSPNGWRKHIAFGIKVLGYFACNGHIERSITDIQKIHIPPTMKRTLRDYEQYCKDRQHLRPSSIQVRIREITIFLDFLDSKNIRNLAQIQSTDLSEFVSSKNRMKPKTVSRIVSDMRSFLSFLTLRGIMQKDLSLELPKIRVSSDSAIPSVWDNELIVKLLAVVDRSSPKGKRDYAILLLACRLGLRLGDIRTLTLDNLKWDQGTIDITQSKTEAPLSLPLTEEVGEALIDYLKSGRPKTTHRVLFLKLNPPFEPFAENNHLHYIVKYWRELAGIEFRTKQHQGLHSLRHSLATRLLQEEIPFNVISEILGHASMESTMIYAKTDVEGLRSAALDDDEGVSDDD